MKVLALALSLLTVGDLVLDHGNGVRVVVHASCLFASDFSDDLRGSLFAA